MKKNTVRWWIIWAVLLVVYNVVALAIPFPKTPVFYVSWAFTLIALGIQIYVFHAAFGQGETVKSKFYGFPIARLGVMYLVAQLLLGLVFMALANRVAVWMPLVVYVVLLGVAVVGLVAADATRDEVERQDIKLQNDVSFMRALQAKCTTLIGLAGQSKNEDLVKAIQKFADELQYSDPVSSPALQSIENDLTVCVDDLEKALVGSDYLTALEVCQNATIVLSERNRQCKLNKGRT